MYTGKRKYSPRFQSARQGVGIRRKFVQPRQRMQQRYVPYRRRNTATMGFLGIEKKFYDTALVSSALTAPADSTGGEATFEYTVLPPELTPMELREQDEIQMMELDIDEL